jgi:hypothetical protein
VTIPEPSPASSGSVDVQISATALPKVDEVAAQPQPKPRADTAAAREAAAQKVGEAGKLTAEQAAELVKAGASGSVDVSLASSSGIPQAVGASDSQPTSAGSARDESQPVSGSGPVAAVAAASEGSGPIRAGRSKRVTATMQAAVSGGVERLGQGIGIVGEGVAKLGDVTKKVPLVGVSVGKLGEGLTKAGESIHALPRVAQTRRGRLLVRSVVVGFLLVFIWIAVIVGFQLRAHDTPDFRPEAERILLEMGKGPASTAQVYEHASPRFQELVKKEVFMNDMADLYATNGKFREITAINETLVTTGPTGRVGRVGLTALFERGISRGSISFHWDKGQWKLLGVGIEVPDNVQITQIERQKRVAACIDEKGKDVSDQRRKCDVRDAAETILEMVRDGRAGEVWDAANDIFKQQESRLRFIQIQEEQRAAIGNWKRILDVTDARSIGGLTATFDIVCEYERSSGVRVEFDFTRPSKFERWKLARFKVTLPMPRPYEVLSDPSPAAPADAGVSSPAGSSASTSGGGASSSSSGSSRSTSSSSGPVKSSSGATSPATPDAGSAPTSRGGSAAGSGSGRSSAGAGSSAPGQGAASGAPAGAGSSAPGPGSSAGSSSPGRGSGAAASGATTSSGSAATTPVAGAAGSGATTSAGSPPPVARDAGVSPPK